MPTSPTGPNPDRQANPSPESPPGAPAATPIPASAFTSNPTNTPEGVAAEAQKYRNVLYYSSIGLMVLCPAVAFAPPRKLDFYTLGLGVSFCLSAGFVAQEHTGRGILWHMGRTLPSAGTNRDEDQSGHPSTRLLAGRTEDSKSWIEKRKEREQEYIDEGRGYGELISDYIKEGLGFKDDEDEKGDGR